MAIISVNDLPVAMRSAELIDVMVAGVNARAARVAPCLVDPDTSPTFDQVAEAKLVLLGALKRWVEAGAGALQAQQAGPFGVTMDTRQRTGFNLWPSEIAALQEICTTGGKAGAFSVDTAPGGVTSHLPWCDLYFGGASCSCGADLAGFPIYELG